MKLKGKENSIFFQVTGKPVDDISHLEDLLMENFRLFSAEFDLIKNKLKKKNLNINYVLFHLLKQIGYPVNDKHFSCLKRKKIKKRI